MEKKPVLWRALSPLIFAAVPAARPGMRNAWGRPLKRWLYKCLLDPYTNIRAEPLTTSTIFGARLIGTLAGLVQRSIFHFGVFEPNLTRWLAEQLRPGDAFVDVGANVGYFSLLASRLIGPQGRVVAIEPSPSTFAGLQRNVELNAASNVRTINAAAYDREATLPIYYIPEEEYTGGASLVKVVGPREADVAAAPLAALLTDDEVARTRVIKIDVEGAERAVVTGLLPALQRTREDVELVIEVLPENADAINATLTEHGFRAYILDNPTDPLGQKSSDRSRPQRVASGASLRDAIGKDSVVGYVVFSRRDAASL